MLIEVRGLVRNLFAWSAVALAVILISFVGWRAGTALGNDSYQYLSEAHHIRAGEGLQTSIVHFDVERAHGHIPAPLTTFPPGYPLLIAFATLFGLTAETAGSVVSTISALGLIPLAILAMKRMRFSAAALALTLATLTLNALAARFATAVMSEPLFTLLSFAAYVAIVYAEPPDGRKPVVHPTWMIISGLLAGLAYAVRYAGVLFLASLFVYHAVRMWQVRGRDWLVRLSALAAGLIVLAPVALRNIIYTSSWKGGNTKVASNPIPGALRDLVTSSVHALIGGEKLRATAGMILLCGGLLIGVAAALVLHFRRQASKTPLRPAEIAGRVYVFSYIAGITYLSTHSVIDVQPRTFYPLLPVAAVLAGAAYDRIPREFARGRIAQRLCHAGVWVGVLGYAVVNVTAALGATSGAAHDIVASRLSERAGAADMRSWIQQHIPSDAPIAATCGQATGYLLDRNTLSLVDRQYSDHAWNDRGLQSEMDRFGAKWLILYPQAECAYEQRDWPYLNALAEGKPTAGMRLAARSAGVVIWERTDAP